MFSHTYIFLKCSLLTSLHFANKPKKMTWLDFTCLVLFWSILERRSESNCSFGFNILLLSSLIFSIILFFFYRAHHRMAKLVEVGSLTFFLYQIQVLFVEIHLSEANLKLAFYKFFYRCCIFHWIASCLS